MTERQDHPSRARGPIPQGRAAHPPPRTPTLDVRGQPVLELGERPIGSMIAHGVRFRSLHGGAEQRWGPLDMTVTLTTHRILLTANPGTSADAPWSTPADGPIALVAFEPPQALRGVIPVRIAGHVRWNGVSRVETEGSAVLVTTPSSLHPAGTLALRFPIELVHRFLAIARAAFVAAKRPLSVDRPDLVEALPAT